MTLMYGAGIDGNPFVSLKDYIVHEYFHVLQGQLVSGSAPLQDGEVSFSVKGPHWLMEGLASYADYAYTPSRMGRRPFLDDRYTPFKDLTWVSLDDSLSIEISNLAKVEGGFTCSLATDVTHAYALSFVASVFLLEQADADAYVDYWKLLGERPTWQQAFEEAFGIGVKDFYEAVEEWLPSQLLPIIQLKLPLRWPDMENQSPGYGILKVVIEDWGTWKHTPGSRSTSTSRLRGLPFVTFRYDEGAVGAGYLSLWWYDADDPCTEHLLGWYKDGELTSRREDATPVEFTGKSDIIEWTLPGHPDTLPRLERNDRCYRSSQ